MAKGLYLLFQLSISKVGSCCVQAPLHSHLNYLNSCQVASQGSAADLPGANAAATLPQPGRLADALLSVAPVFGVPW
jgi:hypothetical protein